MRLSELNATFIGRYHRGNGTPEDPTTWSVLDTVEGAQGLEFQCPKCAEGKERVPGMFGGFARAGAHHVICWFVNPRNAEKVPDDVAPVPGRWMFTGNSIEDITFEGLPANSVRLLSGCDWHGFIVKGEATLS